MSVLYISFGLPSMSIQAKEENNILHISGYKNQNVIIEIQINLVLWIKVTLHSNKQFRSTIINIINNGKSTVKTVFLWNSSNVLMSSLLF